MKRLLIILTFPLFSFSQNDDLDYFFYIDSDSLIFSKQVFKDFAYFEEVTDGQKKLINESILLFENYINTNDSIFPKKMEAYKELIFMSDIINHNIIPISEKIYRQIKGKRNYYSYVYYNIENLVKGYNKSRNSRKSLQILKENKGLLDNHRYISCDTNSLIYYQSLAKLYYDTYEILNNYENQISYGFKFLLHDEDYSKKIIDELSKKYSKQDLRKAKEEILKRFVKKNPVIDSYFSFLDYKIYTDGYSGVNYYEDFDKMFKMLSDTKFMKNLDTFLIRK